jgi:fructose-1,6-bisphosphatase
MVLTFGHGVHRFTLDPTLGEFIHTQVSERRGFLHDSWQMA